MRQILQWLVQRSERSGVFFSVAAVLALLGIGFRGVWVARPDRMIPINSEMLWVSQAFARTGHLADAYGPGSGLTAHVTPAMPLFAGTIYRIFGVSTPAAEIVLMAFSLLFAGISIWGADRAMARLGSPAIARLCALAVLCLAPLNFSLEMQNFRVWEGAVAAAGLATTLAWALKRDAAPGGPSWIEIALVSAGGGFMALASPAAALAIYGLIGLLAWRRKGFLAVIGAGAISAVLLVAISYPWAIRNEAVFGEKVWSRTNFGFNYALGFHDAAINPSDPRKVFVDRLNEVDPYTSPAALAKLRALGGEQAYSKYWTQRTTAWIKAHPAAAMKIAVRHVAEYYFPPKWHWSVYSAKAVAVAPRQAFLWLTAGLAFVMLAWRLLARDWRYLYPLAAVLLPALPYLLAQPILRYRYVVVAILTYLAAEMVWRVAAPSLGLKPRASVRVVANAERET